MYDILYLSFQFAEIDKNILSWIDFTNNCFIFYNTKEKKIVDHFYLSDAYGIEPTSEDYLALYSFNGEIMIYNTKEKKMKTSKNIQNSFDSHIEKDNMGNISNPPYLNKVIYYKERNEIICGLMNGLLIAYSASNLNKKRLKTIHNGSINDIKNCNFEVKEHKELLSYGKDKCLKLINTNTFEIDYYFDISNIIDYDTSKDGNIFYIDNNKKCLFNMKFMN